MSDQQSAGALLFLLAIAVFAVLSIYLVFS